MEGYGFEPQRLAAAAFAEYHPVSSNANAEGRARNRRADIVILNPYPANPQANSGGSSEAHKAPSKTEFLLMAFALLRREAIFTVFSGAPTLHISPPPNFSLPRVPMRIL